LGPTLFIIAINSIFSCINPPCKISLYADDTILYVKCKNILDGQLLLQRAIDLLLNWSSTNGLSFSPPKSSAIHFCRIRNCPKNLELSLHNSPIPLTSSLKVLGLILDNKLSWKPHILHVKTSCALRLNILRKLSHTTYGADRISLIQIYKALILSKIEYGLPAYSSATKTLLSTLDTIQNTALRLSTGAFPTSPVNPLHVEAGVLPFPLHCKTSLLKYFLHLYSIPTLPLASHICPSLTLPYSNLHLCHRVRNILQSIDFPNIQPMPIHIPSPLPPWSSSQLTTDTSLLQITSPDKLRLYNELLTKI